MDEFAKEILQVNIEEEMKQSYLDYAMSVIVGRALPDVRDGLKPVHRRILHAMQELDLHWNRPFKKAARVCGDTTGKYHPHGDQAVYEALVRLAQTFSMRSVLVDGQGNFGSVDGDPPAAMRYTEVRLARIAHEMLADLDRDTVDFVPNYDDSEREPAVFPTRLPNLLVNGSAGIAVGMATNIPPHNIGEVIDACVAYIETPDIGLPELMAFLPGPDFPTAGIINGSRGIREAYQTGRGRIYVRARAHFEEGENGARQRIAVTELPYQVNKARLLEKIAELVKEKRVEGIAELRDESDKDGMRMVIELRRGAVPDVVLNHLYRHTQMQSVFGINLVALVDSQPRLLTLRQMIEAFVRHRREVVTRRTIFDLRKARDRAHVLEGLAVALANIDQVIALIRAARSPAEAKAALRHEIWPPGAVTGMLERAGASALGGGGESSESGLTEAGYRLSDRQAQAILDLRLHRLTGLEQDKILGEYEEILSRIEDLLEILEDPERMKTVVREELIEIKDRYADPRRTEIVRDQMEFDPADLVTPGDAVVTFSHWGYVKWQPVDTYVAQKRGGKGKTATTMKEEDFIDRLFVANTHDQLLCFSSRGKVYWRRVYELPPGGRTARGSPMVNLLPLESDERISAVLPVKDFGGPGYVLMATERGLIKKTLLSEFSRPRSNGIIAIDLLPADRLIGVAITDGEREVMLASSGGRICRFNERQVRPMGRAARGVIGMRITEREQIISLIVADDGMVLTATENGYGKCTRMDEYPRKGRGTKGVISIRDSGRNGGVTAALAVGTNDEIMLMTDGGKLVRTRVAEVSVLGRNTQGVKLIRLVSGEHLAGVERVIEDVGDNGYEDDAE